MSKTLDDFLNRKTPQSAAETQPAAETGRENEPDEIDYRAFGVNRGGRQVLMLDVRTLTQGRRGFAYSYLENVLFDASGFLVLSFGTAKVAIKGRNLAPLYESLLNHKVRYIRQENPDIEKDVPPKETFIASILIDDK